MWNIVRRAGEGTVKAVYGLRKEGHERAGTAALALDDGEGATIKERSR
jgi:hypothetical protein